jgi:hypothetical protein
VLAHEATLSLVKITLAGFWLRLGEETGNEHSFRFAINVSESHIGGAENFMNGEAATVTLPVDLEVPDQINRL